MKRLQRFNKLGGVTLTLLFGCGEDAVTNTAPAASTAVAAAATYGSRRKRADETEKAEEPTAPPKVEFQEDDFVETERSRDPFRSFGAVFVEQARGTVRANRTVILEDYSVDDLKLIGIVSRITPAKAMLIDPLGQGHVVHRNDYVGKAERVQVGTSSAEYEINWRVDRIREADVVLIREDPTNPDVPSATRVIGLRPEDGKSQ